MIYGLYITSVLGALALMMMLPRHQYHPSRLGMVLAAAALGGAWLLLDRLLDDNTSLSAASHIGHYLLGTLAIIAACRVITHTKPVFAALWFVLVIIATAGLLLILEAEFVAFALIIVYGGAILVTYVFVIMLAAQSGDPERDKDIPPYDNVAREPWAACTTGFVLLALLLTVFVKPMAPNERPGIREVPDKVVIQSTLTRRPADRLASHPSFSDANQVPASISGAGKVTNTERVGLDLFERHPLGLELAGVILMVAIVGAVVISRQKVDHEEAESRPVAQEDAA